MEYAKNLKIEKDDLVIVTGWWARRSAKGSLDGKTKTLQRELVKLEEELNLFEIEVRLFEYNPVIPYLKLAGGIFGSILSLLIFLQIFLGKIITDSSGTGIFEPMDELLAYLMRKFLFSPKKKLTGAGQAEPLLIRL